jgi:hypothetical protein
VYNPSLFEREKEDIVRTEDIDIEINEDKDENTRLPAKEKKSVNFVPKNKIIKELIDLIR